MPISLIKKQMEVILMEEHHSEKREHHQPHGHHEEKVHRSEQPRPAANQGSIPGPDKFWKIATVALIIVLAVMAFRGPSGSTDTAVVNQPSAAPAQAAPSVDVSIDDDYILGDKDAPVTIVEFSDYQCPFCGRFYQQTLPQLKSNYIDTGKVRLVFRDFPLSFHPEAEPAAIAANCAGEQGKYYEFHDKVFENQATMSSGSYKQWAQELGLDLSEFDVCLKDPAQKAEVRKDFQDGGAAGVQGTPAFFVNGKLVSGAQPYQVFEQLIEAELS
jgi:protein-disulfide isomerase